MGKYLAGGYERTEQDRDGGIVPAVAVASI